MPPVPDNLQRAVLAVLAEAKASNVRLTRTALFKFVYLLDCLHAEAHGGDTASDSGWYFHHYGPFAVDLADGIDTLAKQGLIQSRDANFEGKDFIQYWLGEYPTGPTLSEIGLTTGLAMRFSKWLRSFAGDMSKLLDLVYFDTLPMASAVPGAQLDFSELAKAAEPARRQVTHIKDPGKILKLAQLQEKMKQSFLSRPRSNLVEAIHRPVYDDAFRDAMELLDTGEMIDQPIAFKASL